MQPEKKPRPPKGIDPRHVFNDKYPEAGLPGGYESWKLSQLPLGKPKGGVEEEMRVFGRKPKKH